MWRSLCKSKIHRAVVTDANLNYEGSLTLDAALMEAADLVPFEQVHVLNLNNGERFETYLIEGERGSGVVCVNGAAARLVQVGDPIIVLAYAWVPENALADFRCRLVFVDECNRIVRVDRVAACASPR
ncbi:Aspartate 1-decarboxylase [bacterium HR17]|jgi:aspartate 1-decarboxylase|uniref:Aspartate 1-decarboxylase n=1 Tax=Candidatus Fervidibacter japonicus TaxID=2035412 RepID=A0A2H5X983_9BACT|nr:Aspartate 1-decarboxylase [bacterium HR17]